MANILSASARDNPGHAREIVDARRFDALQAAEMREQRLALARADPSDLLQLRRRPRLRAPRAMALDREAVRFVADLLQQVQPRMIRRQVQHVPAIGKDDVLLAGLALGAFGNSDQPRVVQPLLRQHLGGDADLPLAAIDDEQIGRRILADDDPRAAPRQCFAHRRVIVAADGRSRR